MARSTTGRRRINGQGTVWYDRARGKWRAQFYDADGIRRPVPSAPTRGEVEAALRTAQAQRDAGDLSKPPSQTPTLGDWLTDCVEARAASVAASTAAHYRLAASRISRHIGNIRLDKIDAQIILRYQNRERARGLSEGSLLSDHRVLKRALADAVRANLLRRNPLEGVRAPKPQRTPAQPLTEDECRAVLDQARSDGRMPYAMRRLNLLWGPRQSEVLGLKWSDLNLTTGHLYIQRAIRRDAVVGRHVKPPKSSEGTRTLRLDTETLDAFRAWRGNQLESRLAASRWDEGEWIFTGRWGAPLEAGRDSRLWKSLLQRAGVRHVRLHDARHTAGTLLNATGTDARTIQRILGHADVHTTLTYYVKPTDDLVAAAGARMADLVRVTR